MGKPGGAAIEWGPLKPVPQSLVAPFEAFHGKPVAEMSDDEKIFAARAYLAASFGEQNEMTPHLQPDVPISVVREFRIGRS